MILAGETRAEAHLVSTGTAGAGESPLPTTQEWGEG